MFSTAGHKRKRRTQETIGLYVYSSSPRCLPSSETGSSPPSPNPTVNSSILCAHVVCHNKKNNVLTIIEIKRLDQLSMCLILSLTFWCVSFQTDNKALVCRTFQRAIVQNHELTRSQSETLVQFLMDNCTELFKVFLRQHKSLNSTFN